MNDGQNRPAHWTRALRWMARLSSLLTNSVFLLILGLALINEDKPQGPAIAVLVWLALTMIASLAAWRWEQAGGALVIGGALGTSVATYLASLEYGLGAYRFVTVLLYGLPFLMVGVLFWLSGRQAATRLAG